MSNGHNEALDYAARGWQVVPIKSGTKRPSIKDWVNAASTDEDKINKWWSATDVSGVGIVTGPESGIFVLDVDTGEGKWGDESLADLVAEHGALPDTVEVVTGSGGTHYYFAWPDGENVATSGGSLGPGLDIRGVGGQVVAPGSVHPETGQHYEWEASSHPDHIPVAAAPRWLLDLLKPTEHSGTTYEDKHTGNNVAVDNFNMNASNDDVLSILLEAGWTNTHTDKHGIHYVARPGKTDKGFSASIGKVRRGVLYVFSEAAPGFDANRSYDPTSVVARALFNDNMRLADDYLVSNDWGVPTIWSGESTDSHDFWQHVEAEIAANEQRLMEQAIERVEQSMFSVGELLDTEFSTPKATALVRTDGAAALYPGRVHSLVAEPESGKSWMAGYLCLCEMEKGNGIVYWDIEGAVAEFTSRLVLMGLTEHTPAVDRSYYWTGRVKPDEITMAYMTKLIREEHISLVIIDSTNRSLTSAGKQTKSDTEYNEWHEMVPQAIADAGAMVVLIDHVVKDKDSRGRYASGTEAKLGQVDLSLGLEVVEPFDAHTDGTIGIRINKDRPGGVRGSGFGGGQRPQWGLLHLYNDTTRPPHIDAEGTERQYKRIWIEPWKEVLDDNKKWNAEYPSGLLKKLTDTLINFDNKYRGEYVDLYLLSLYVKCTEKLFDFAIGRLIELGLVQRSEELASVRIIDRGYVPQQDPMNLYAYDPDYVHDPNQQQEETNEQA